MRTNGPCVHLFAATILSFSVINFAGAELPDYPMTLDDMEVLAGYYTSDGKYLGGIPEPHDVSRGVYHCTNFLYAEPNNTAASNATVCSAWSADESYGEGFKLGTCECTFYAQNNAYCSDWVCEHAGNGNALCQCDDDDGGGSENSRYCDSWSCRQIGRGGRVEHEEFHCQRSSPTEGYCEAWNGNVTASDEVGVVACECVANWNGDEVCSFWECEELSLSTCKSAGYGWCDLGMSLRAAGGALGVYGVTLICWGLVGMSAAIAQEEGNFNPPLLVNCLLTVMGVLVCVKQYSSVVVIRGGVDGAIYVGIIWSIPLTVTALYCAYIIWRSNDERRQRVRLQSQQNQLPRAAAIGRIPAAQRGRAHAGRGVVRTNTVK